VLTHGRKKIQARINVGSKFTSKSSPIQILAIKGYIHMVHGTGNFQKQNSQFSYQKNVGITLHNIDAFASVMRRITFCGGVVSFFSTIASDRLLKNRTLKSTSIIILAMSLSSWVTTIILHYFIAKQRKILENVPPKVQPAPPPVDSAPLANIASQLKSNMDAERPANIHTKDDGTLAIDTLSEESFHQITSEK
jgi:hypothetical protein